MANEQYRQIFQSIQAAGRSMPVAEVVGAVIDGLASALGADVTEALCASSGTVLTAIYSGYKLFKSRGDLGASPNPHFVFNGHCDASDPASPVTLKYVRSRLLKKVGAGAVGTVATPFLMGVDVASGLQHINATGSTLAHLLQLRAIAQAHRQSETIARWLDVVISMKMKKAAHRGASAVGALVPGAGLPVGIAKAVIKIGMKLTGPKLCYWTASEMHWRAFVERRINRNAVGPAGRIITELFTRRGATRVFGKYDIDAIIHEPCGWMAVADKILLI